MRIGVACAVFVAAVTVRLGAQDFKAYQNYDFVPGDQILFEDDFSADTDGEFAAHWKLEAGQGAVNKMNGQTVLAMTDGTRRVTSNAIVWVTAGLVVYGTVDAAFRNGALALGVTAALALGWIALGHDRQLDRERDRLRMAGLDEPTGLDRVPERVG